MARGGISFAGIGAQQATFKAGANLKALVDDNDRDYVVGMPVVISGAGEVDLGNDGDTIFGFVDVYEDDGHVGVQFRGFREEIVISTEETHTATVGKVVAVNGAGEVKDSSTTAKLRAPVFIDVDEINGTATVFLG